MDRVKETEAEYRHAVGRTLVSSALTSCKVYTSPRLAEAMVRALGDNQHAHWLEPSVGEGAFLTALEVIGVPPDRITAIDLERAPGLEDSKARTLRGVDFIEWSANCGQTFDRIIGNPPFVSLSKLERPLQEAALRVRTASGLQVSLSSNYWYAFVCACLNLLNFGGSLAFVLPASWDYADYAEDLRTQIAEIFERVEIHRSNRPLFASVQDGSIVLLALGYGQSKKGLLRFVFDNAISLTENLLISNTQGDHGVNSSTSKNSHTGEMRLGDVIEIRLGGVTGAASFFLLTEQQRRALSLPVKSVRPVLSKARHLIKSEITIKEWQFLRDTGQRIWLFDPSPAQIEQAAVKNYLDSASTNGEPITNRYKIRIRKPWYRTPLPRHCHGFISGMSRQGPWICVNEFPGLNATNTLYAVTFKRMSLPEERFAWALSLMTTQTRNALSAAGRVYADGLIKHEPGDLINIRIKRPKQLRGAKAIYKRVIKLFLAGDVAAACELAEGFGFE